MGMLGKEDRYVQRAENHCAVMLPQLSITGHSPARDIVHLLMSEQKLHGPEVPSTTIDQGSLGPPQRMRPELQWVETDAGSPFANETRVLPGGEAACFAAAARKQELPRTPSRQLEVVIDRLPSLLGDLEPDWPPGLPLSDSGSVERVTVSAPRPRRGW